MSHPQNQTQPQRQPPKLICSGFAYYKMRYLATKNNVEVGGWGLAKSEDAPLLISDIRLLRQESTPGSIDFDDAGIVEYMEDMVEEGLEFPQFMRVWFHPGNSAHPSGTDRTTFEGLTGTLPWVVMAIIAKEGQVYSELGTRIAGHHVQWVLPFEVDWRYHNWKEWDKEYDDNVVDTFPVKHYSVPTHHRAEDGWIWKDGSYRFVGIQAALAHDKGLRQGTDASDPPAGKAQRAKRKITDQQRPAVRHGSRAQRRERKRNARLNSQSDTSSVEIHGAPTTERLRKISEEVGNSGAGVRAQSDLPVLYDPDQPPPSG